VIVFINGVLSREPLIPASVSGIWQGDGLFETVRVCGGRGFRLGAHLERLRTGLAATGIAVPAELEASGRMIARLAAESGSRECLARITVVRCQAPASPGAVAERGGVWWLLQLRPLPAPSAAGGGAGGAAVGLHARLSRSVRAPFPGPRCKSLSFQPWMLARREALAAGADEALLSNQQGQLVEGAWSNLFWVEGRTLRTPPLSLGPLPGVTRALVLELAAARGLASAAGVATAAQFQERAHEAFLTSSGLGVMPLLSIDGQPLGDARPGLWTGRLRADLEAAQAAFRRGGGERRAGAASPGRRRRRERAGG
jgi:branched-subunit amino acid aminotransferase/4-amino-4-deoxychorismate lyase